MIMVGASGVNHGNQDFTLHGLTNFDPVAHFAIHFLGHAVLFSKHRAGYFSPRDDTVDISLLGE